ncbi:MAG: RNA 2',3'-cyclic phosphodiesterase, partial [Patescibacteria group bacterium]
SPAIGDLISSCLKLLQENLTQTNSQDRLISQKNAHLSLAFLGEVNSKKIPELSLILEKICTQTASFTLEFVTWSWLKAGRPLGVLKAETNSAFDLLQKNVLTSVKKINLSGVGQPPHLTLIRTTKNSNANRLLPKKKVKPLITRANGLSLVSSQLTPSGPIYTILKKWDFKKEKFRRNVIICLLNKNHQILLIKHQDRPLSWQFPQGGLKKSENITQAAQRELQEETGLSQVNCLLTKPNFYRYRWPQHLLLKGKDPEKKQYVGQIQSLVILQTTNKTTELILDKREAIQALWVKPEELLTKLPRARQLVGRLVIKELKKIN